MRMRRWSVLSIALMMLVTMSLSACSKNENESASTGGEGQEKVNIVFWNSGFATIDENNKAKKKKTSTFLRPLQGMRRPIPM